MDSGKAKDAEIGGVGKNRNLYQGWIWEISQNFLGAEVETLCEFRGFFLDREEVVDYNRIALVWGTV
jgi:hypothetical protein